MAEHQLGRILCFFGKHKPFKTDGEIGFPSESYCVRCRIILGLGGCVCDFTYNCNKIKYIDEWNKQ